MRTREFEMYKHIIAMWRREGLMVREAIVFTLFARYLKRVSAQLGNILTTVINPFHLTGYKIKNTKVMGAIKG